MTFIEFQELEFEGKIEFLHTLEVGAKRRYDVLMHRYRDNLHHTTCIKAEYAGLRDQRTKMIKRGCIPIEMSAFMERYERFTTDKKKPA